eukprot:1056359-Pyramimonas_sp.AAC.1
MGWHIVLPLGTANILTPSGVQAMWCSLVQAANHARRITGACVSLMFCTFLAKARQPDRRRFWHSMCAVGSVSVILRGWRRDSPSCAMQVLAAALGHPAAVFQGAQVGRHHLAHAGAVQARDRLQAYAGKVRHVSIAAERVARPCRSFSHTQ